MIPYGKHHIDKDDIKAVVEVLKHKNLTQGSIVSLFENKIAKYVKSKFAVVVSSCTAGLHLSAIVAGINKTKTSITSPISFVASANCLTYCGGKIKFADIDKNTINISPKSIINLLKKKKINCIIPVHFGGLSAEMKKIKIISKKNNIKIIEDAAHAFGARYDAFNRVGSCKYSDLSVFSFHPVKSITTGEGGCITTNNKKYYEKLIRLRSHGIEKKDFDYKKFSKTHKLRELSPWYYEMQELGYHYRLTDIQCALGISQLSKVEKFLKRRKFLAERYDNAFEYLKNCFPIQFKQRKFSSNHLYVLRINFNKINKTRSEIMKIFKEQGIITQVHYIPISFHPFYKFLNIDKKEIPNSISYYQEALSIPLYYDLTISEQDYVIKIVKKFIG